MREKKAKKRIRFFDIFMSVPLIFGVLTLMLKIYSSSQILGIEIPLSIGNIRIMVICTSLIIAFIFLLIRIFIVDETVMEDTARSKMISDMINEKEKLNGIIESYEIVIKQIEKDNAELREKLNNKEKK